MNNSILPKELLPMTNGELLNHIVDEIYIADKKIIIKFNTSITFLIPGDFEITTDGELSVLSRGNIALDGKEVHLKSYNSKQIREMKEELLKELYEQIGKPQDPKEVEAAMIQYRTNFKEEIKRELLEELKQ